MVLSEILVFLTENIIILAACSWISLDVGLLSVRIKILSPWLHFPIVLPVVFTNLTIPFPSYFEMCPTSIFAFSLCRKQD